MKRSAIAARRSSRSPPPCSPPGGGGSGAARARPRPRRRRPKKATAPNAPAGLEGHRLQGRQAVESRAAARHRGRLRLRPARRCGAGQREPRLHARQSGSRSSCSLGRLPLSGGAGRPRRRGQLRPPGARRLLHRQGLAAQDERGRLSRSTSVAAPLEEEEQPHVGRDVRVDEGDRRSRAGRRRR